METIKTSKNVEFDVIYADGTRHHVSEGVLFEVKDDKFTFHNGTDRAEVLIAVAEAAAEAVGGICLNDEERLAMGLHLGKRVLETPPVVVDIETNTEGGQNNAI